MHRLSSKTEKIIITLLEGFFCLIELFFLMFSQRTLYINAVHICIMTLSYWLSSIVTVYEKRM